MIPIILYFGKGETLRGQQNDQWLPGLVGGGDE